ncbi:MAG TPA: MOSC domain-containing protein [Thermoplasmata archaeon]|nr:MOSC domain-containing protein [Thermoplasmata archaeon]
MRPLSINIGTPVPIGRRASKTVLSAIGKAPVQGSIEVRRTNLEGDRQADLRVHGGEYKAVYVYPSEHYPFWRKQFPDRPLPWGSFGENFTTEGLLESEIRVGDELLIGSAGFAVTQPRSPCYKLGLKFGTEMMVRWFYEANRPGFYLRVRKEGRVSVGDSIHWGEAVGDGPTILSVFNQA